MNTEQNREDAVTLEILDTIEKRDDVSQRHLARQLGVALGLANSYLKRCIRKGYIKVSQAPANRYLYYLTPKGFAEKSRLTAQYLSYSLSFYRKAGDSCLRIFDQCEKNGWKRLVLCGISDLAEIASVRALERDIQVIGFLDPDDGRKRFLNGPVWKSIEQATEFDVLMLTDLRSPTATHQRVLQIAGRYPVLVPDVLSLQGTES